MKTSILRKILITIYSGIIFTIASVAMAEPHDRRNSWQNSYAACVAKGHSPVTCSTYPDRGNDGGQGYAACIHAGNSPMECSVYESKASPGPNLFPPRQRAPFATAYAVCVAKGHSPIACSTYPDRGNDGGQGYAACIHAGNSPVECSVYSNQAVVPAVIPTSPQVTIDPTPNEPEVIIKEEEDFDSKNLSYEEDSSDQEYFKVDWRTDRNYECEKLRKRYPNQSFLVVAQVSRSTHGFVNLDNPSFCFSKAREKLVNKQLRLQNQDLFASGYLMMSLDSVSASKICQLFGAPSVATVQGFSVRREFALYRFTMNGSIIAENAGVDPSDSNVGIMQNMTSIQCKGDLTNQQLAEMKPILLK